MLFAMRHPAPLQGVSGHLVSADYFVFFFRTEEILLVAKCTSSTAVMMLIPSQSPNCPPEMLI